MRTAQSVDDLTNDYVIMAEFDPSDGTMSTKGTLVVVADKDRAAIELLLNSGLEIERMETDRPARITTETGITIGDYALPSTQRITIVPQAPLARGERIAITFGLSGKITTDTIEIGRGVVTPGWSELSMEALWYPVLLDEPMLRSDVRLTLPEGYEIAAPGRVERMADGSWRLRPNGPVTGRITFITSNNWSEERRRFGDGLTGRVLTIAPEPRAAAILDGAESAFVAFRALFGPPISQSDTFSIVYANRDIGIVYPRQAYSTGGDLIVLDDSEERVQLDTLHHEIAHFWWSRGTPGTPDEFLSESVSEYLAVRHGGDHWGKEWLTDRLRTMRKRSAAVEGSLREIDGLSASRQDLLYNRGPLALFALQEEIGRAAVDDLLIKVNHSRVETLAEYLTILAQLQSDTVAERHASLL